MSQEEDRARYDELVARRAQREKDRARYDELVSRKEARRMAASPSREPPATTMEMRDWDASAAEAAEKSKPGLLPNVRSEFVPGRGFVLKAPWEETGETVAVPPTPKEKLGPVPPAPPHLTRPPFGFETVNTGVSSTNEGRQLDSAFPLESQRPVTVAAAPRAGAIPEGRSAADTFMSAEPPLSAVRESDRAWGKSLQELKDLPDQFPGDPVSHPEWRDKKLLFSPLNAIKGALPSVAMATALGIAPQVVGPAILASTAVDVARAPNNQARGEILQGLNPIKMGADAIDKMRSAQSSMDVGSGGGELGMAFMMGRAGVHQINRPFAERPVTAPKAEPQLHRGPLPSRDRFAAAEAADPNRVPVADTLATDPRYPKTELWPKDTAMPPVQPAPKWEPTAGPVRQRHPSVPEYPAPEPGPVVPPSPLEDAARNAVLGRREQPPFTRPPDPPMRFPRGPAFDAIDLTPPPPVVEPASPWQKIVDPTYSPVPVPGLSYDAQRLAAMAKPAPPTPAEAPAITPGRRRVRPAPSAATGMEAPAPPPVAAAPPPPPAAPPPAKPPLTIQPQPGINRARATAPIELPPVPKPVGTGMATPPSAPPKTTRISNKPGQVGAGLIVADQLLNQDQEQKGMLPLLAAGALATGRGKPSRGTPSRASSFDSFLRTPERPPPRTGRVQPRPAAVEQPPVSTLNSFLRTVTGVGGEPPPSPARVHAARAAFDAGPPPPPAPPPQPQAAAPPPPWAPILGPRMQSPLPPLPLGPRPAPPPLSPELQAQADARTEHRLIKMQPQAPPPPPQPLYPKMTPWGQGVAPQAPPAPKAAGGTVPPPAPPTGAPPAGGNYYDKKIPLIRPGGGPNILALEQIGDENKVDPVRRMNAGKPERQEGEKFKEYNASNFFTEYFRVPTRAEISGGKDGIAALATRTSAYSDDFHYSRMKRVEDYVGRPLRDFPKAVGEAVHSAAENRATPEQLALIQRDPAAVRFLEAYKDVVQTAARESLKENPLIKIGGLREDYATRQRIAQGVGLRDLLGNIDVDSVMTSNLSREMKQGFQRFREGNAQGPFDARDGLEILIRQYGDHIYKNPAYKAIEAEINRRKWQGDPDAPFENSEADRNLMAFYLKHSFKGERTPQEASMLRTLKAAAESPVIKPALEYYDWMMDKVPGVSHVGKALSGVAQKTGMTLDPYKPITSMINGAKSITHQLIPNPFGTGLKHFSGDATTQYMNQGLLALPTRAAQGIASIIKRAAGYDKQRLDILFREGIIQPYWSENDPLWRKLPKMAKSSIQFAKLFDDASKAVTWDTAYTEGLARGLSEMEARRGASATTWMTNNYGGPLHKPGYRASPLLNAADIFNVGRLNITNNVYDWFNSGSGATWAKGAGLVGALVAAEQLGGGVLKYFHFWPGVPALDAYPAALDPDRSWIMRMNK